MVDLDFSAAFDRVSHGTLIYKFILLGIGGSFINIVTLSPFERYLNWVDDPAPPPSRYHGDLTSPAPSGDHSISPSNKENTSPQDAPRNIPWKLRPHR